MKVNIILTVVTCICFSFPQGLDSKELNQNDTNVDSSRRILFGWHAIPTDFPYFVKLGDDAETWFCGGSIITAYWILTAAHCLEDQRCSTVRVRPAVLPADSMLRIYGDECHLHHEYVKGGTKFDMALIKVGGDLLQQTEVNTIPLPVETPVFYPPGSHGLILGWGLNEHAQMPGHLVATYAPVIDWYTCNNNFKSFLAPCQATGPCALDIPRRSLCVQGFGDAPDGSCLGDLGGPIVINGVLAGISTLVPEVEGGQCAVGAPSVYTMTVDYLPWIYSFIDPTRDTSWYIVRDESPQ